jgi:hypothetical protein
VIRFDDSHDRAPRRVLLALAAVVLLMLVGATGAMARPSEEPFKLIPGSFHITSSSYQAGAHANWTATFDFKHNAAGETFNDLKDTIVNLPAGFMGNANKFSFPTCTDAQLVGTKPQESECPPASQVGTISFYLRVKNVPVLSTFPVYNMEVTNFGVTAELGFNAIIIVQFLDVTVRPGDSGITVTAPHTNDTAEPRDITLTTWGLPASHEHDAERGRACFEQGIEGVATCDGGNEEAGTAVEPFLANPTSCGMFHASMQADSWGEQGKWTSEESEVGPFTGCERIHFDPSIKADPTTNSAESPSGLDVSLEVPQTWENPEVLATSTLKDTRVVLPEGYTVNPSAGSGLVGCTPQEYETETAFTQPGEGCPAESKLGKVEIETPVLSEKIKGNVYIAQPYDNRPEFGSPEHPGGSLLALYIVAKAPDRGVIVKAAGKIEANPVTGQLVTTFDDTPQQPFNRIALEFTQGTTSPLVSPSVCGSYTVLAELTPWSAPSEPRYLSNSFQIERGIHGGACPTGGIPPFKPTVIAGAEDNAAANYSPFYLRIAREDGEQEITKFSTVLPPGLTGNLTGIPFCSEAEIEAARHATGQQEINDPSCPLASEIGHTLVGAGVGSVLAWTPGRVYLAGPYHGSALSIVSITSATVGPFDLGTVVVRFALRINPITAQAEIDSAGSDPIPHIIDGIVVHVRDIHVYVDRPHFILDPTNCQPMSISDTVTGTGADYANPADQVPVSISTPFQAADCQSLQFKPTFKVTTPGKTSRRNGAGLSVKLTYPSAAQGTQTNIRSVKVDLPKQLPSRLTTLQKACPDKTFEADPAACPSASIVGHASANTPILPVPITGPAYFVSHGGAKFPELIIVLQGYGVTIDLHGETFISKQGITSSTFRNIPDEPIGSFELTLPQGSDSALAANGSLCTAKLAMPTAFTAQNGDTIKRSTPIAATGCAKHKAKKASKHKKRKGKKK